MEHLTYYACGLVLLGAIVAAGTYAIIALFEWPLQNTLRRLNFIFWVETAGVLAFSVAWLTKGKMLTRPLGLRLDTTRD